MKLYTLDNQFIEEAYIVPSNFKGIVEWPDGTRNWFVNRNLHRLDGPAIEYKDGQKYWYIDDKQVTKEQCNLLYSIMKLKGLT